MSKAWAGGSTRAWRKTRARVLTRDGWVCRLNVPGVCTTRATCVHHTHGRARTGDDEAYLIAACEPCNLHVGDPDTTRTPQPQPRTRW